MYIYIYNLFIGGVVVVVTGVRPASGSLEGGATITIDGSYFDDTDAPATVDIDGKTALFVCVYNVYVRTLSACQYHSYLYAVRAYIETINVSSVITVNDEKSNDKKISRRPRNCNLCDCVIRCIMVWSQERHAR